MALALKALHGQSDICCGCTAFTVMQPQQKSVVTPLALRSNHYRPWFDLISVLEASLQTLVQFQAVLQPAVIGSPIGRLTIGQASEFI